MLLISLVVVGFVSWWAIPLRLLPEGLNPPFLWLWIGYPNASPEENQEQIARPIEELLWTVKGIKEINARCHSNGVNMWLEFTQSADMDVAYLQVRDRMERARAELPSDLRYYRIHRYSENDEPIIYFGISITGHYDDPYRLVEEEVVKPLQRIDGVAAVEMWGGQSKQVRVELQLDRLKALNVNIGEVVRRLRQADFAVSAGSIEDGGTRYFVRIDERLNNLEKLEQLPIGTAKSYNLNSAQPAGMNIADELSAQFSDDAGVENPPIVIYLKDIARISYSAPPMQWIQRIGRRDAIQMGIFKQSEANTVELCQHLNAVIDEMEDNPHLKGLKFEVLFDQGKFIRNSLNNLIDSGLWGGLFAIIVLFYFLRRVRMTVFVAAAIPVTILATVIYLYFIGWSLDVITLSGLMICVGMVVDNAIVVTENIHTRKSHGDEARTAALVGAQEVALAITLATGTTMVVFLPIMLMSGDRIFSFYMLRIGMPVIVSLAASLLVALLFIPLAVQRFSGLDRSHNGKSKSSDFNPPTKVTFIERVGQSVEHLVRQVLNNRSNTLIILLLILGTTALPMSQTIHTDEEEGNINDFHLRMRFPVYYTLAQIDSVMRNLERQLYAKADRYDVRTVVTGCRRGFGRMRVFLNEAPDMNWIETVGFKIKRLATLKKNRPLERKDVIKELKDSLKVPPGVQLFTSWRRGVGDENAEYVSVYGEDNQRLLEIVSDIETRLTQIPKVITIEPDLETAAEEIQIRFDRDLTARYGIDPAVAAIGVSSLIRGVDFSDIWLDEAGVRVPLHIELQESDRATYDQLLNLPVSSRRRTSARLGDVAQVQFQRGLGEITRENRRTRIRIKITSAEDNPKRFGEQLDAALASLTLPTGYEWSKGRRFRDIEEQGKQQQQAWLLAAVFVMLLMGALFESFILPWSVIVTVPFSFFGVWWTLWLTGTQFGIMSAVGVIVLIGVVVNNAIVLVDHINRLRRAGLQRDDALAVGARERFRPIAMTALTTICGLLPMAFGSANLVGIPYAPMGRTIIGGLLTATISTPLVVPLIYSYLEDMQEWVKKARGKFRKKR
ncbi:MAG: efflux RND transporter permease subunit [Calditrichaeota bacterium]|nr:efflux RND transporter permease subunit [Calditrichota bacterium]